MKLEEYLKGIRECPDEWVKDLCGPVHRLNYDFGVNGNYEILLVADFHEFRKVLEGSDKFKYAGYAGSEDKRIFFNYVPGTVQLQVINGLKNVRRDMEPYNVTIIMHTQNPVKMEGVLNEKATALAIEDLAQILVEEEIQTCFYSSRCWEKGKVKEDFVVFVPSE